MVRFLRIQSGIVAERERVEKKKSVDLGDFLWISISVISG